MRDSLRKLSTCMKKGDLDVAQILDFQTVEARWTQGSQQNGLFTGSAVTAPVQAGTETF